ncbi:MAG: RNA 2',3'-cyclic phosphodiesterase [Myxococcota bacterium]|jgi:2'-5' RNA ligase|nr:RNA 2',3'-cyclic phosphodiesterase [Myxococcota bacterium]
MSAPLRLFVAITLPDALRDALLQHILRLKALGVPAAYPASENLHLSLAFLGDQAPERVSAIDAALRIATQGRAPFTLDCASLGVFYRGRSPQVLWLGLQPQPALSRLHAALRTRLEECGIQLEKRPYSPHITLARLKKTWGNRPSAQSTNKGELPLQALLEGYLQRYAQQPIIEPKAARFEVQQLSLFQSELLPSGARYRCLSSHAFAP